MEQKIYYSHPTYQYNTQRETENIDIIDDVYPDSIIINPTDIKIPEEDMKKLKGEYADFLRMQQKYFFPSIKECDIFIYDDSITLTGGVKLELMYAKHKEIEIKTLNELKERMSEN